MRSFVKIMIAAMLLFIATGSAQEKQTAMINGTVRDDETGAALAGCNVLIEGTALGTASDAQGNFQLSGVPFGRVEIVASFIGYEKQRLQLDIKHPVMRVNIRLSPQPLAGPAVTVIATRARERETPVAFATLTAPEIDARYFAQDVPVLLSELPSTTYYSESGNGIGYNYLAIRGFDQRRISVLVNGVPQNDPEDHNVYWLDFPDLLANVEDVQVQRGAGSAFYGPPAIGGSVNILTSELSTERKMAAYVGGGTYNTSKLSLALNSGLLGGKYLVFGRLSRIQSDGYRHQSWVDFKSYFLGAARVGEKSTVRLHFYGGPIEDHLAYYGIPKIQALQPGEVRRENPIRRPDEIENFNQPHLELIHEYRASDRVRLNNTVFWIRGYGFFDYDGSWAPMSYYRLTPEFGFDVSDNPEEIYVDSLLIRAYVDNNQIGWLPQVTWSYGRGELTAGGEFRLHRSLHWGRIEKGDSELPLAVSGEYRGLDYVGVRRYYEYKGAKNIFSPYVHATFRLRPEVNLMLDLQYVHQQYRLYDEQFIGTEFEVPYNFLNPHIGVNYNFSDQFNLFASFSRTSREPRLKNLYDAAEASTPPSWGAPVVPQFELNPDGTFNFDKPLVKPEKLNDYELGLGYRNGGWRADVNFFYMDFDDEIIKSGQLDRFGQPITGNAPRTLHTGIELAASARILPALTLSGNLMLSQNEFQEHTDYSDGTPKNLAGNPIAGFPDALANARLSFSDFGFTASLAMQYAGKQYTDNFKTENNTVDAYTVFNGTVGYVFSRKSPLRGLALQMHLQNIFDKLYITHGESEAFFPAAERQVFVNAKYEL